VKVQILLGIILLAGIAYYLLGNGEYIPKSGDLIFQSSPHNDLVDAIEGVTESRYSHAGIVIQLKDKWIIREALRDGVCDTPLQEFVDRGRDSSISVFRVKKQYEKYLPLFIEKSASYLGRPYDNHYLSDDEHLYCSELIYKSFKYASGVTLGKLQRFGDLKWGRYKALIEKVEGGTIPTDRLVITPAAIAKAKQLKQVYSSY
jgi:uncharacterized protein YycO